MELISASAWARENRKIGTRSAEKILENMANKVVNQHRLTILLYKKVRTWWMPQSGKWKLWTNVWRKASPVAVKANNWQQRQLRAIRKKGTTEALVKIYKADYLGRLDFKADPLNFLPTVWGTVAFNLQDCQGHCTDQFVVKHWCYAPHLSWLKYFMCKKALSRNCGDISINRKMKFCSQRRHEGCFE